MKGFFDRRYKLIIFISAIILVSILFSLCCFPLLNETILTYKNGSDLSSIILRFDCPVKPEISDYIIVEMRATNTGGVARPYSSIAIELGEEIIGDNIVYSIKERTRFYIDGVTHRYYIPIGENRYYIHEWELPEDRPKDNIESLTVEIPDISGVSIEVEKIEFKKRNFFALDSHINYLLKNNFNLNYINRYIIPAYFFIISALIILMLYILLSSSHKKHCRSKNKSGRALFLLTSVMIMILLLSAFSIYFTGKNIFIARAYFDSYKNYITTGNLKETYRGFNDFEDYILWLDKKIPEQNDLIVALRGDPVYITAEMAYNLYPRDLKFINTSDKNEEQIIEEIKKINKINKNSFSFIAVLAEEDFTKHHSLVFIDSFSSTAGFLFRLEAP